MDEKSSQTSEMAVKISEKRSELALERVLMPTKRRKTQDYATESPTYNGMVLCGLFESQDLPKSCFFYRTLAVLNIERLNFKQYLNFDSPSLLIQSRTCSSGRAHASTRHMI